MSAVIRNRTWPYIYEDGDGDELEISPVREGVARFATRNWVTLFDGDPAALATAIYEAMGKPAPVIVERPAHREHIAGDPDGAEMFTVTPSPAGSPLNVPGVKLQMRLPAGHYEEKRLIGDEPLRLAVALVDAKAEADSAPQAAEIDDLLDVMYGAGIHFAGTDPRIIAEAIIRSGYRRETSS